MSRREATGQEERTGGQRTPFALSELGTLSQTLGHFGAQARALQPLQSYFPLPITLSSPGSAYQRM